MASLNKMQLIGNLTHSPELKYTDAGTARCRFSVAVNRKWKDQSGQDQEEVTFVPVTTWGKLAENCEKFLSKGRPVYVEGRLRIDSFETDDGEKKKIIEVVAQQVQFLGGGKREEQDAPESAGHSGEDEVPF